VRRQTPSPTAAGLGHVETQTLLDGGVGSTLSAVMNRVPQLANCIPIPGGRLCQTGAGLPGERLTAFFLRNGRVTRVVVAFVID
jgi:hypothetical protein